jgi:hypothetical protein
MMGRRDALEMLTSGSLDAYFAEENEVTFQHFKSVPQTSLYLGDKSADQVAVEIQSSL